MNFKLIFSKYTRIYLPNKFLCKKTRKYLYIRIMVTYKEQLKKKTFFVINKENLTIGIFTNLRKLCEEMKVKDNSFPSYWTIVKLDKSEPIKIKDYIIQELQMNNAQV